MSSATPKFPGVTTDLGALGKLNADYIKSVATSDVRWFDQNLTQDFLNTNADGSLVDRATFLDQIAHPPTISNLACEDVRIRILGNMAIIHARTTYKKADGQLSSGRYTDVWTLQNGRWLCLAAHVNRG